MGNLIFSGIAEVAVQGDRALRFVNCFQDRAVYEIIGFEDTNISLNDYRSKGLQAIRRLMESGDLHSFAPTFNTIAQVDIWETEDGGLSIELNDADRTSNFVLWIAIGWGDMIPAFNYVLEYYAPMENSKYAILSVYQVPGSEFSAAEIMDSNSASSSGPWEG
jgi:hypothetical protein